VADVADRVCEKCGETVPPDELPLHHRTTHVDSISFLIRSPNRPQELLTVPRLPDGFFDCQVCSHRERDSREMVVSRRPGPSRPAPELEFEGHIHNCMRLLPSSSDEESLAAIDSVGVAYVKKGTESPIKTITIHRSAEGFFECPWCTLYETDAASMEVRRPAVRSVCATCLNPASRITFPAACGKG
jgi:hypothetical protein